MRKILIFILTSSIIFGNNSFKTNTNEEIKNLKKEIENIKKEKENLENLRYDRLDIDARKELDEYSLNISQKIDLLKDKMKLKYKIGKIETAGASFLNSLEDEGRNFNFGMNNRTFISKNSYKNSMDIFFTKNINNEGNIFGIGGYIGYTNSKYKKYTDKDLHGVNIGLILEGELPEYGINIVSLNEYNKDFKIKDNYSSDSVIGGLGLMYKKDFGKIFYIEPMIFILYGSNLNSKLKFKNTEVLVKNNFMYNVGGNLKLGVENEINENLYNFYFETSFDKKIKKENYLVFKFKDKDRFSNLLLENDINLDLGLGLDILLKKEHRLHLDAGIGLIPKEKIYKLGIGYELLK